VAANVQSMTAEEIERSQSLDPSRSPS